MTTLEGRELFNISQSNKQYLSNNKQFPATSLAQASIIECTITMRAVLRRETHVKCVYLKVILFGEGI